MRYRGNRISDDVCLILVGTGRLKRILAVVVFYVFLLVVWVMRVCVVIFFRRRFLSFYVLPSP
ncbi:hypothetical protein HMPREF9418_0980 [Neisseria macacae ATCC 33926]|uniref:Transmembrane protein n=1 Tax=Neisseria macacae ATCC 33926 TaxID=997348 RepID=A0AA36UK43_9NEIS|nr:hypothetical protein HMPREF9418_0980 [Neisseria macacae ATCC 33926]